VQVSCDLSTQILGSIATTCKDKRLPRMILGRIRAKWPSECVFHEIDKATCLLNLTNSLASVRKSMILGRIRAIWPCEYMSHEIVHELMI